MSDRMKPRKPKGEPKSSRLSVRFDAALLRRFDERRAEEGWPPRSVALRAAVEAWINLATLAEAAHPRVAR